MTEPRDETKDLYQTLLELEYGLLDAAEEASLRERIASESDLARLHTKVLLARETLADATRVREAAVELSSIGPAAAAGSARPTTGRVRRWISLFCGIAASILAMVATGEWLWHSHQLKQLQTGVVVVDVTGPAKLNVDAPNQFEVVTKRLDEKPAAVDVNLVLRGSNGDELYRRRVRTSNSGRAEFNMARDVSVTGAAKLEVLADGVVPQAPLVANIATEPVARMARLSTDRPVYQPGETIYYRAVSLERLDLRPAKDGKVAFELFDPSGKSVPGSRREIEIEKGVAFGDFPIPADQPGGRYTLKVRSANGDFEECVEEVVLRAYRPPRFRKELEFGRDSYSPGEQVTADLAVNRVEGNPAASVSLNILVMIDAKSVFQASAKTGEDGTYRIVFKLPDAIEKDDALLSVAIDDGGTQETIVKEIPLAVKGLDLAFFPESGVFVPGVENRVYFHALGPDMKPVHVKGRILDSAGAVKAAFETTREGMGCFAIAPAKGNTYRVQLDSPSNVNPTSTFPVAGNDTVLLSAVPGVFDAGKPVDVAVKSTVAGVPLVLSATCRGVPVASRIVETVAGSVPVSLAIPEEAGGVLRLTLFDRSKRPMVPLAERLIYRRPRRLLSVSVAKSSERSAPGESVDLAVSVRDEAGRPAAGAVLGVAVVDRSSLSLLDKKTTSQETSFFLASEIKHPADLENADFYLSSDPEAAAALDLVLGTHGWRTFRQPAPMGPVADLSKFRFADGQAAGRVLGQKEMKGSVPSEAAPLARDNTREALDNLWNARAQIDDRHAIWSIATGVGFVVVVVTYLANRFVRSMRAAIWFAVAIAATIFIGSLFPAYSGATVRAKSKPVEFVANDLAGPKPTFTPPMSLRQETVAAEAPALLPPDDSLDRFDVALASLPQPAGQAGSAAAANLRGTAGLAQGIKDRVGADFQRSKATAGRNVEDEKAAADGRRRNEQEARNDAGPMRYFANRRGRWAADARSDFSQTLYWNPLLITDADGEAKASFDLSDAVTTFDVKIDGHSTDGRIGSGTGEIVSRQPIRLEPKLPLQLGSGDQVDLPIAIHNETTRRLQFHFTAGSDGGFQFADPSSPFAIVPGGEKARYYIPANVNDFVGSTKVTVVGVAGIYLDRVEQTVEVAPRGFPGEVHRSGRVNGSVELAFDLPAAWQPGTLRASLRIYPDPILELLDGAESMLRTPHGCFEQASSSNYPNVLILRYLQKHGLARPDVTRRCRELLASGYYRLVGFECKSHGYEWFGRDPGHEALTAYGILQFHDMQSVYDVDRAMLDRTKRWLLNQRDGNGGYRQNREGADSFAGADPDTSAAYITWSLVESGETNLDKEIEHVRLVAKDSSNPYLVALAAMTLLGSATDATKNSAAWTSDANHLLERLATIQGADGSLVGDKPSVTGSTGESLRVETTSLAALAWLKSGRFPDRVQRAANWLRSARNGSGGFGTTQATILALKALLAHSESQSARSPSGDVDLFLVDSSDTGDTERLLGRKSISAATVGRIHRFDDIAAVLKPGPNRLRVKSTVDGDLGYALGIDFQTETAPTSGDCAVDWTTKLDRTTCGIGDLVTLNATLRNRQPRQLPMTIAILGLPAGLEAPVEMLDRLKEKGLVDYYETRPREIAFYWRSLKPLAAVELPVRLVASVPGRFTGPPSRAYLYYTPERKFWLEPVSIEIRGNRRTGNGPSP